MAKRSKSGVWERFSRTGVILILVYVMCLILGFAVRLVLFSDQKHSSIIPDKVVASAAGTSKADGSDGGHEATNPNILELKTDQKFLAVLEGGTASITVNMATTGQASAGDLVWSSSNTDVAAVDNEGVVTGVAKGSCEITAAVKGNEDISVSVPVTVRQLEQRDGCTYVDGILIVNKTYSLPSDFDPGKLDDTAEKAFEQLQADAAKEGLDIYIGSDFRSYSYQVDVYESYCETYGWEMADTFSARPGFSEHQTGLTIDCNTIDDAFGQTKEAQCWQSTAQTTASSSASPTARRTSPATSTSRGTSAMWVWIPPRRSTSWVFRWRSIWACSRSTPVRGNTNWLKYNRKRALCPWGAALFELRFGNFRKKISKNYSKMQKSVL